MPCWSKEHADSISAGVKNYWASLSEESRKKIILKSGTQFKPGHKPAVMQDCRRDEIILKSIESRIGGFWYGNVRNDPYISQYKVYNEKKYKYENKYCELWTEDLKERIRAYWGYVSALSEKPETVISRKTGTIRTISCHHIYYQKKACCIWDEDECGYYANVNIGTFKNHIIEKYYINGDPNKFVTLTASEHKQTDTNKIHYIKTFEKLIEDQGGKCYFTITEIEELLKDDLIACNIL